jgi:hypothetical protein
VVISTANLTEQQMIDGSWCQRFPRANGPKAGLDPRGFGAVLADLLRAESEIMEEYGGNGANAEAARRVKENTPLSFLARLGVRDLAREVR